jgi:hypothetical protein
MADSKKVTAKRTRKTKKQDFLGSWERLNPNPVGIGDGKGNAGKRVRQSGGKAAVSSKGD